MTSPDGPILLDLDPSGYIQGLSQADRVTNDFGATVRTTAVQLGPMQKAMGMVTPSRATLASMTAFTAVAARQQQQLSGLAASSQVTGVNFGRLTGGMRQLARELPVGNAGARDMVLTLSKLGVVSGGTEKPLNQVSKSVQSFNKSTLAGIGPGSGLEKLASRFEETFGARGKITGTGAEKRINDLSRTFLKLGGATSEAPTQLAASMVQLNRSMGTGMEARRVMALSDSLTTLSAQSGSSATGILEFSKSIAPLANASGMGQTQVMGISAAFSKLGDDGFGAATAFNRMLGDMHRSVREGTPQMAAYAQIVGKTTTEFQELFKASPGEAMTQVVEAIGKSGNAPRQLEQLGLDGVRTARYLTNLAQSGDLRGSIATAVSSYGGGATERASGTAFGGLNDSLARLATTSEQAAEALGTPFLGAVTNLTDLMGAALQPLRAAAESGPAQAAGTALAYGALPALIGMKMLGPALTSAGLFQMGTSGPVRGLLGGYAAAGGVGGRLAGRLGGNAFNDLVAAGLPVGTGRMLGVNTRAAEIGAGLGRFTQGTIVGAGGPSLLRQVGGGIVGGAALYARLMSEQLRLARMPFSEREGSYRPGGDPYRRVMENTGNLRGQYSAGTISRSDLTAGLRKEFSALTGTIGTTRQALSTLGRGALAVTGQGLASGAVLAGRGIARGAGAVAGAFGGPVGLGLTAAMGGYMISRGIQERRETMLDSQANATSWIDDYRVAMGKATDATTTFAGRLNETAEAAANAPTTAAGARRVTEAEMDRALASRSDPVRNYGTDPRAAANMLRLQAGTSGIAPDELNRVQQDLFKSGFGVAQVREIMRQLPADLQPQGGRDVIKDLTSVVGDLASAPADKGFLNWRNILDPTLMMNEGSKASSPVGISNLSGDQKRGAEDLTVNIRDRAAQRSSTYGAAYGTAQMLKEMDAAIEAAMKSGNVDLQRNLTERFQAELGLDTFGISTSDLKASGGFSAVLARENRGFREGQYATARSAGGPQERENWAAEQVQRASDSNVFGKWLSTQSTGPIQTAVQALIGPQGSPEDPGQQLATMQAAMTEARQAGTDMGTLARQALEAANAIGNVADASHQFAMAMRQAAIAQETRQGNYQSSSQYAITRGNRLAGQARLDPNDPSTQAAQAEGVAGLQELEAEAVNRVRARLHQQREFQVQSERMNEDYGRQRLWSEQDFDRQIGRAQADFARGMLRGEQDFGISRARMVVQYNLGRARAEQDFRIGVREATEDFHRSRLYAERDFNKSMRRAAEDGARSMYDPYQRIQVKPVWDAQNLMGNLEEQVAAIEGQMLNLDRVRAMGLDSNAIKMLGLNDPNNAQQLAQIVHDMANDPAVAAALNDLAGRRRASGMALASDPDSTERQRALEDFTESQRRGEEAFNIGMDRQHQAFQRQLARGEQDFATSMNNMSQDHRRMVERANEDNARGMQRAADDRARALERTAEQYATTVRRMREDIKRADTEIVGSIKDLTWAMNTALQGQFVDFQKITVDGMKGWVTALEQFKGQWQSIVLGMGTELSITVQQSGGQGATDLGRGVGGPGGGRAPGGDGIGMGYARQEAIVESAFPRANAVGDPGRKRKTRSGNTSYHTLGRAVDISPPNMAIFNWIAENYPNSKELIYTPAGRRQLNNGKPHVFSPGVASDHWDHIHWAMKMGGVATRPTKTLIAEAGYNEAIVPLNSGGAAMMADALARWVKMDDVKGLKASGGITYQTFDYSTTTHDNRVIIENVELKADSPRELADAAAARARRDNLTAAPQTRRNR